MENIKKDSGLSFDFSLDKGKFSLSSGTDKKRYDLLFFLKFDFVPRVYRPLFKPDISWVLQKPRSYVNNVKVLLLGNLRNKIYNFVEGVEVVSMNLGNPTGSKELVLFIEYRSINSINDQSDQVVIEF